MKTVITVTALTLLLVIQAEINGGENGVNEKGISSTDQKDPYKIIVMVPFATKSHVISIMPLIEALAKKGHQLTFISMLNMTTSIPGIEEIVLDGISDFYDLSRPNSFYIDMLDLEILSNVSSLLEKSCRTIFQDKRIAALLERKFDVALVDSLLGECTYPIISKLQIPYISICTTSWYAWITWHMSIPTPYSYIPHEMTSHSNVMNFKERIWNTIMHLGYLFVREYYVVPVAEKYIFEYFPDFPGIWEMDLNASLVLANTHTSLDAIRPSLPFVIEVGGMHCRPGQPLSKNLEDFIQKAGANGFIYFSLGSCARGTDMPSEMQQMFLKAFAKLKEYVIWKFEADIADLPQNVLITKWAPQQDLLAHPAMKLFMTHGGQLSTHETVYHSVPVIGMPLFGDQVRNIANLVHKGIGQSLDHYNLNVDIIYNTIRRIIDDKSYKENAEKYSKLFKDRPEKSVDKAAYWVEYVIKHKGAHHLKPANQHLNFFQYFLIDVIILLFVTIAISIYAIFYTMRFVFNKITRDSENGKLKLE